jgi:hypothetical protein
MSQKMTAAAAAMPPAVSSSPSLSSPSSSVMMSPASGALKRPYIRTKRPKDYNDRSTVTTTTDALYRSAVNPYDGVLAESSELLRAANEAQQLGRYKMASTYLLLLHARLVGLGRRFDKVDDGDDEEEGEEEGDDKGDSNEEMGKDAVRDAPCNAGAASAAGPSATPSGAGSAAAAADSILTPNTRAARELTRRLPKEIQFDTDMLEHLARAAVELHAARSGTHHPPGHAAASSAAAAGGASIPSVKFPHDFKSPHPLHKSLYRVPDARAFLAGTANRQGITTAATAAAAATSAKHRAAAPKRPAAAATATAGIAWTDEEIRVLSRANATPASSSSYDAAKLAALLPGRTEQQVRTFLKNQNERLRVHMEAMEALPASEDHRDSHQEQQNASAYPRDRDPSDPVASAAPAAAALAGEAPTLAIDEPAEPSRPAAPARKPATAAIYTVPHAVCDVRALLARARQEREEQQQQQRREGDPPSVVSTPKRRSGG